MKTQINITENNWFQDILTAVRYVYTGHEEADGLMRPNYTLTLEREGEPVKYITGLTWKDFTLTEPEKNNISNILIGFINTPDDIIFGRSYTELLISDKIYLNTPE
jgi:hypothetical protein